MGRWEWAGHLPPKVIEEAKAELSFEAAVADALMAKDDYGPEVEKLAKEKMNRAIAGEEGAARDYILRVLMGSLGSGGDLRGDTNKVLDNAKVNGLDWASSLGIVRVKEKDGV